MDSVMRAAIGGPIGAAINDARAAVEHCPATLWNDRSEGAPFWQIAYHTLFCLHMYSCPSLKALTPARFHVEDAQFLAGDYPWLDPPRSIGVPAFVFSKADVLSYLQECREHCIATLEGMTLERAAERCGFPWYNTERRRAAALESAPRNASHRPTRAGAPSSRGNWRRLNSLCRASRPRRAPA